MPSVNSGMRISAKCRSFPAVLTLTYIPSFLADLNHVENGESVGPIDFQSAICFHRFHYEDGRHCRSTTISTGSIAFEFSFFMRFLSADYVLI
jgi:hypothetical protein